MIETENEVFRELIELQAKLLNQHLVTSGPARLDGALGLLANRCINEQNGTWLVLKYGYFNPAVTLLRNVYEMRTTMLYLKHYPAEIDVWWKPQRTSAERRRFQVESMRRGLVGAGVLDAAENDLYAFLSAMSHPSADSVFPAAERKQGIQLGALGLVIAERETAPTIKALAKYACDFAADVALRFDETLNGSPPTGGPTTAARVAVAMSKLGVTFERE